MPAALSRAVRLAAATTARLDAFSNFLTGLGEEARDRRVGGVFRLTGERSQQELDGLWVEDGIGRRLVTRPPEEMFRAGWELDHDGDPEDTDKVLKRFRELGAQQALTLALNYQRAYGGGAILLGTTDDASMGNALEDDAGALVRWLEPVDRHHLFPANGGEVDKDTSSPTYGLPLRYTVTRNDARGSVDVHRSRLIIFDGFPVPPEVRKLRQSWGGSQLEVAHNAIRNWRTVADSFATMATDQSTWVHKIPGLMGLLKSKDYDVVKAELLLRDRMRGIVNAMAVDANGGDAQVVSRSLSGIEQLALTAMRDLAANSDVPLAILFGVSASTLGQTNEADILLWEAQIASQQDTTLRPAHERLLRLIMLEPSGATGGKELKAWKLVYRPLRQQSPTEKATVRKLTAEADTLYEALGVPASAIIRARTSGTGDTDPITLNDAETAAVEFDPLAEPEPEPEPEPADGEKPPKPPTDNKEPPQ